MIAMRKFKKVPSGSKSRSPNSREDIKKMVKNMIESKQSNLIKFKDTINSYNFVSASANEFITFSLPSSGTGSSARIGDSIDIREIDLSVNAFVTQSVTTSVGSAMFRLIVLQFVGEVPSGFLSTEVVEYSSTQPVTFASPLDFDNNKKLFHVLYDGVIGLDTYNRTKTLKLKLKPKIKKLRYDNGVPIWTSGQPAFFLYPFVLDGVITTTVDFEAIARVWYYDV